MHLATTIYIIALTFVSMVAGLPQYGGDGVGPGLGAGGGYGRDGVGYGNGIGGGRGAYGAAESGIATAHHAERVAGSAYLAPLILPAAFCAKSQSAQEEVYQAVLKVQSNQFKSQTLN
ncbi:hypothetical protein PHISCL_06753 [Aspergillus sclerotialis]|uniref:Uncharacterized protein n=1 Tax=Aspergillus sclerotialis TaxID=2070753 RepID=A0A3A2ZHP3_9EURO|nr:hypothetical protein PHISCL_06753 [Aspergillus sclerotialis]